MSDILKQTILAMIWVVSDILRQAILAVLWAIGQVIIWLAKKMTADVESFLVGTFLILLCLTLVVDWVK